MNKKYTKRLSERIALNKGQNGINLKQGKDQEEIKIVIEGEEDGLEQHGSESGKETILVDFDFDTENQTNFDVFMTVRYFWKDWNPLYTEVF